MTRAGLALALVAILQPGAAWAQEPPAGMPSEAEMGQLMEAMQGMQACMAGIDQSALQKLQQRAEQAEAEMLQLCRADQEAAAKARALALGQQMAADPTLKTMQACLAKLPKLAMLQSHSPIGALTFEDEPIDGNLRPICERLK